MLKIPYDYTNLRKIDKGLTNDNYLIDMTNKTYIVRVPKEDTKHLFNRDAESEIIHQLEGEEFTLPTLYYKDGLQIAEFKENLINFEEYKEDDKIEKVASLMKQLHASNIIVDFTFNPIKQTNLYYDNLHDKPFNLNEFDELFKMYDKHIFTPILTHNDWVEGNICYIDNHTVLIDYEYAGMNDRYFDIMSFVTENDLSDNQKKEFIYLMFDNTISSKDKEILAMYRDINNLLWYLWALMMYEFRNQEIYKDIAYIKKEQLYSEYMKPLDI